MSKRRYKSRQRNQKLPALFFIGAGLILLGIAGMIYLPDATAPKRESFSASAGADGLPQFTSVTPVRVEMPAPDLQLATLTNQPDSLTNHLGEVVLINNWAIWCPPCKAELPHMEAFYQRHKDKGFTIIAIDAGDPAAQVTEYVRETGLTFPIWLDPQQEAMAAFRNGSLPSSYVVDREGTIVMAWTGAISEEMLERYVAPLLVD